MHSPLDQVSYPSSVSGRGKVLISINTSWNIANFRAGLVAALIAKGFEVVAAAPLDAHSPRLGELGCRHVPIPMDNKGLNPLKDVGLFLRFWALMRRERPDVFLGWTIKPNVYGGLAAQISRIPVINNVSGLGTAFIRDTWLTQVVKLLYWIAFRRSIRVFFQNSDDCELFSEQRLLRPEQSGLLPGSGIDLDHFAPVPRGQRRDDIAPVFILIARLLWDKGVGEYVEAARKVRHLHPDARFQILGFLDVENRSAVPRELVAQWQEEGAIEYLGASNDVRPFIAAADCVVLPSYREGTPRSLLEAAAMGKPLITTDVPGCREVVDDRENGFLCEVRNAESLANALRLFINSSASGRDAMGRKSRKKAEDRFDQRLVIAAYLGEIERAVAGKIDQQNSFFKRERSIADRLLRNSRS